MEVKNGYIHAIKCTEIKRKGGGRYRDREFGWGLTGARALGVAGERRSDCSSVVTHGRVWPEHSRLCGSCSGV